VMLHNYLIKDEFMQYLADPCVHVCFVRDDANMCIIIVIWVDDLIISASNSALLLSVKDHLSSRFKMKDPLVWKSRKQQTVAVSQDSQKNLE
jgi:hypothetical protein